MAYCTIEDIRAAGVTVEQASDEQVTSKIAEAVYAIDRTTRRWFESRDKTIRATGAGLADLRLEIELIAITSVTQDGDELDAEYYEIVPSDVSKEPNQAKLRRTYGAWPQDAKIVIIGSFGYVDDPDDAKTTPLPIKRACIKLTVKFLEAITSSLSAANALVSEKHRDYSYTKSEDADLGKYGDPDIDGALADFTRVQMRAV